MEIKCGGKRRIENIIKRILVTGATFNFRTRVATRARVFVRGIEVGKKSFINMLVIILFLNFIMFSYVSAITRNDLYYSKVIGSGGDYSVALKEDGSICAWGKDDVGQVSNVPAGNNYVQVACGLNHVIALREDGSLVGWGGNHVGQINVPSGNDFVQVSSGRYFSTALREDGSLVGWGKVYYYTGSQWVYANWTVPAGNNYVQVSCGTSFAVALKDDGTVIAWGRNRGGEVTNYPRGNGFVQVSAGGLNGVALKEDGTIVTWGQDNYSIISNKPSGEDYVQVCCAESFAGALKRDGSLVFWGSYSTVVNYTPITNDFVQVCAGNSHALALKEDGTLVSWGANWGNVVSDTPTGNDFAVVEMPGGGIKLDKPTNLVVINRGYNFVQFTWDSIEGAEEYYIYLDGIYKDKTVNLNLEFVIEDLLPLEFYKIGVKAVSGDVVSSMAEIQAQTLIMPAVESLRLGNITNTTIGLVWDSIHDAVAYNVYLDGVFYKKVTAIDIVIENLNRDLEYYLQVAPVAANNKEGERAGIRASIGDLLPAEPCITHEVDNTDIGLFWNYQENCDGYKVYINGSLAVEVTKDEISYSFSGDRGESYRVEIEAFNEFGTASTSVNITISHMPTPGAGTMAGDIIKYAGAATASMGGLLALGFALQSSGGLMGLFKLLFRR